MKQYRTRRLSLMLVFVLVISLFAGVSVGADDGNGGVTLLSAGNTVTGLAICSTSTKKALESLTITQQAAGTDTSTSVKLYAALYTDEGIAYNFDGNVTWSVKDDPAGITVTASGTNQTACTVSVAGSTAAGTYTLTAAYGDDQTASISIIVKAADEPSTSPSTSPSASPSTSPSASPSTSPSASPSTSPSSKPTSDPFYQKFDINIKSATGGKVKTNVSTSYPGKTVTITVSLSSGYELDSLFIYTPSGTAIGMSMTKSGGFTFTMPESDVTIVPTFKKAGTTPVYYCPYNALTCPYGKNCPVHYNPTPVVTPAVTSYSITVKSSSNGSVRSDVSSIVSGKTVTLTWTPANGYTLESLSVTKSNGASVSKVKTGTYTYTFTMPEANVTVSASFKKVSGTSSSASASSGTVITSTGFSDVESNRWSAKYITALYQAGIIDGVGSGLFMPAANVTRAQFLKILSGVADVNINKYTALKTTYSDVSTSDWFAPYVVWGTSNGIVTGRNDGTFDPNGTITRQEAAVMIARYCAAYGIKLITSTAVKAYADDASIPSWAQDSVYTLRAAGILDAASGNTFAPTQVVTREEVCEMLYKLMQVTASVK